MHSVDPASVEKKQEARTSGVKTQKESVFVDGEQQQQQQPAQSHLYSAPPHMRDPNEWQMFEDPDKFEQPKTGNVTYNLWQLGNHRVVIRCGYHGYYRRSTSEESTLVHFQPKLEFQLFYGYEQLTPEELSKAWLNLAIRSASCRLHRVHINARSTDKPHVSNYTEQSLHHARRDDPPGLHADPAAVRL